jgi:hypothetical protein
MRITKKEVWEKIKERDINFPFKKELFTIIEEHFDRIDFIKDHVGIRDFMFIAEEDTKFTANFFVAINVECEKSYSYKKNLELFLAKYNANPLLALKELVDFFEQTERILYIGIGFKESEKIEEDKLAEELLSGKYTTQEEILKAIRKFPEWYAEYAKYPEEVSFITVKAEKYIKEVLRPLEKIALKRQLDSLLLKDDLTNKDKELLKTLAHHLTE